MVDKHAGVRGKIAKRKAIMFTSYHKGGKWLGCACMLRVGVAEKENSCSQDDFTDWGLAFLSSLTLGKLFYCPVIRDSKC